MTINFGYCNLVLVAINHGIQFIPNCGEIRSFINCLFVCLHLYLREIILCLN